MPGPFTSEVHVPRPLSVEDRKKLRAVVEKAQAAPLYVYRPVVNAAEIIRWAKDQGFTTTLPAEDLHVTITYSKNPVDWMAMGENWSGDGKGNYTIEPGGPRIVQKLGEKATVLLFASAMLSYRHQGMVENGASWDFAEYQPHVTLSYDVGDLDLATVEPFRGKIVLGPECFEPINDSWSEEIVEKAFDPSQPRDPGGEGGGQWTSSEGGSVSIEGDVVRHDGEAVGTVKTDDLGHALMIDSIEIGGRNQGKGIGSSVIRQIQARAGDKPVVLDTDAMRGKEEQKRQRALYERLGFKSNTGPDAVTYKIGSRKIRPEMVWRPEKKMDKNAPVDGEGSFGTFCKVAGVNEDLGLVFGWAIVCKRNGEPYFDLNIDHDGQRVPEHITETAMLKGAAEFMQTDRVGNDMHRGPDSGSYVFAFPLTEEIAKAMAIETKTTGLMVAYKPESHVLAKFKSGEYTGFSIEGSRVKIEELT